MLEGIPPRRATRTAKTAVQIPKGEHQGEMRYPVSKPNKNPQDRQKDFKKPAESPVKPNDITRKEQEPVKEMTIQINNANTATS